MTSSRKGSRKRGSKRPTATIDLKAKEVSTQGSDAAKSEPVSGPGAKPEAAKAAEPLGKQDPAQPSVKKPDAAQSQRPAKPVSATAGAKSSSGEPKPASDKTATKATSAPKPRDSGKIPENSGASSSMKSALTHLAAGGLGGLLVMLGAQQFQGTPADQATLTTDTPAISEALKARLAALEKSTAEQSASSTQAAAPSAELVERITKLESLNETLAELSEAQNKLTSQTSELNSKIGELADPSGGGAVELRTRLDSMEGTIGSLAKAAEGADNKSIPQLAALAGRINDLQTELEAKVAAARKATAGDLESRFNTIEETLKKTVTGSAATREAIETLTGGNKRVSLAVETARTESERFGKEIVEVKTTLGKLNKRFSGLDTSTAALATKLEKNAEQIAALPSSDDVAAAVAPVSKKLGAVEQKVTAVLNREETRANSAKQIVLALELANLRRALDRGQPVAGEIKRIKASAPEGIDLTPLDKLAANGVPTAEDLTREFSKVAAQAIDAETSVAGTSAFDKLLANARSIVRVRKTGDVEGESTEAIVARAEDDLKRSDIKAALSEVQKLSGLAAEAASDWAAKARDRLSVDAVLEQIEAGLKTSVSNSATN
ncbi:MAG: hypothetical protein ACR2O4_10955 [Hyphomicrobiaceae bacterium]